MGLLHTLKYIASHPLNRERKFRSLMKFFSWQLRGFYTKNPITFQLQPGVQMWLQKGMRGASGNFYCGLHEYEHMMFLLHFLRKDDLFVDVGANVGSYTLLAAGACEARVIAFEPGNSRAWLEKNIALNHLEERVQVYPFAVGDKAAEVNFTANLDTMNHVVHDLADDAFTVQQVSLDAMLQNEKPVFIKIDVEGYECEVLQGMEKTLRGNDLCVLQIECQPELEAGKKLFIFLEQHQFLPYHFQAQSKNLLPFRGEEKGLINVLFLRNLPVVEKRIQGSL